MAAIAFDTLKATRRLKEAGFSETQAEAQAELMAEAFIFNMDAIVTRDYLEACLDARFGKSDARVEAQFANHETSVDKRFTQLQARMEQRFAAVDTSMEQRFAAVNAQMDKRFAAVDLKFAKIDGQLRLHSWILAAIAASTVIPALHQLFRG
jgi:hypothetical protein